MKEEVNIPLLLLVLLCCYLVSATLFFISYTLAGWTRVVAAFSCAVVAFAAAWWGVSMSLVMADRYFLGLSGNRFSFPITLTEMHTVIKGGIAISVLLCRATVRRPQTPENGAVNGSSAVPPPNTHVCTCCAALAWHVRERFRSILAAQRISRHTVLMFLAPMGLLTGVDIWMSKAAIQRIDVSIYTVVKSSALVFTFIFSMLLKLQRFSWQLLTAVGGVCLGVGLATVKPVHADTLGVAAGLFGAACSAARWVLIERFFGRAGVEPDAFAIVGLQAPFTFIFLAPIWLIEISGLLTLAMSENGLVTFVGMVCGGGVLAFALLMIEVQLVHMTSALSMNMIGQLKDIAAVSVAFFVFHEPISPMNAVGTVLAAASAVLYSLAKRKHSSIGMMPAGLGSTASASPLGLIQTRDGAGTVDVSIDLDGSEADSGPDSDANDESRLLQTIGTRRSRVLSHALPSKPSAYDVECPSPPLDAGIEEDEHMKQPVGAHSQLHSSVSRPPAQHLRFKPEEPSAFAHAVATPGGPGRISRTKSRGVNAHTPP
jgi:drug/metabolite transporter (DMT)-like permease